MQSGGSNKTQERHTDGITINKGVLVQFGVIDCSALIRRVSGLWSSPSSPSYTTHTPYINYIMPHAHTNTVDEDITAFANTVPPPPYSITGVTGEARPRLPEEKRNIHLATRKYLFCSVDIGSYQYLWMRTMSNSKP